LTSMENTQEYMNEAIELAQKAALEGEVPVGAVVVFENRIIGKGYNRREATNSPSSHAEMIAIEEAAKTLNSWRLENCDLYVTLEPCIMCSGAIIQSRIRKVYFGTRDPKGGAVVTLYNILSDKRLNHQTEYEEGLLHDECSAMLTNFFREIRKKQKQKNS